MMNRIILITLLVASMCNSFAKDYFVGGPGASDNNPGTTSQPFATIQKAASLAVAGDIIKIRSGTYRETVKPANSGIVFQPDNGATVVVSGLNVIDNNGWAVHSGNIYKKTITLPVNGFQQTISSNTTIVANQIFKDGAMMFEARYPKISSEADLMDQYKWRHQSLGTNLVTGTQGTGFQSTSITDGVLGTLPNLAGAKLFINGWFGSGTRTVSSHSGNRITFPGYFNSEPINVNFRKWWYVTGKLGLLTTEKEWHYESNTLYFRQPGGGSPTSVEYKARNWAFDLRGRSNITIAGIQFIGCEVATGDTNTNNCIIDNVRAKYTNHFVMTESGGLYWDISRFQTGTKLIGSNNVVKNSEFDFGASQSLWLGSNGRVTNCKISNYGYDGNYGSGVNVWGNSGDVEIDHNTIFNMGRSCIDFGASPNGTKFNLKIHHNDLYAYGMLNHDVGAVYTGQQTNTTGTVIHHNWIHDSGSKPDPQGIRIEGLFAAIYFDQGTGPATIHHNVCYRNFENMPAVQDVAEFYILSRYSNRQGTPGSLLYNNTFNSNCQYSYVTYITTPLDVQRNNIYRKGTVFNWGASPGNIANSLLQGNNPQFVGTGPDGLAFRLTAGSSGINKGIQIAGITDGSVGVPDIGAYEYGGTNWVPGYVRTNPTPAPQNIPVVAVSMAPAIVTVVGATSQLSKTITPLNATNQNVSWTTSNATVATVNSNGLVSTLAVGNATITVTTQDGSFKATSAVTVTASQPLTGIDDAILGSSTNQHNYSGTAWIHAATQPAFLNSTLSYSNVADNAVTLSFVGNKIEWYTEKFSTHGIAAVSIDNGAEVNVDLYSATAGQQLLVYTSPALAQGTHNFKIRVTGTKNPSSTGFYTIHDFVKVYSGSVSATGITLSPSTATLIMGGTGTLQLIKTISPGNATNQNVSWTTSNPSLATVNVSGLVTAVGAGSAIITATTQDGSFKATSTITITASQVITGIDNAILGSSTNQHNYSGAAWIHAATQPSFLNSTLSYSNVTNNAVTLSFVGNKIEWYTEKFRTHGIAAVSIDNGPEVNVDLYAATGGQRLLVYTSPTLAQGNHIFKIRVTGTKNPLSTGLYAIHDFVKVYSSGGGGTGGGGATIAISAPPMEEELSELQAFPNPIKSGGVLHLELPDATGALKISDMMGKSKYILEVTERTLDIPTGEWADGMYLVIYKSPKGMKTKKIIIQ